MALKELFSTDIGLLSVFTIGFVIVMAVSEAAVGFALILSYFRRKKVYDAEELNELKG